MSVCFDCVCVCVCTFNEVECECTGSYLLWVCMYMHACTMHPHVYIRNVYIDYMLFYSFTYPT